MQQAKCYTMILITLGKHAANCPLEMNSMPERNFKLIMPTLERQCSETLATKDIHIFITNNLMPAAIQTRFSYLSKEKRKQILF